MIAMITDPLFIRSFLLHLQLPPRLIVQLVAASDRVTELPRSVVALYAEWYDLATARLTRRGLVRA